MDEDRWAPFWVGMSLALAIVAGFLDGVAGRLGCSENVHPNTSRADLCEVVGSKSSLLLFVVVPLGVLLALAPLGMRRLRRAALAIFVIEVGILVFILTVTT